MLLTARNIAKSYGAISVLHAISFVVNSDNRIGLVGSNGVGKSTLLTILVGQEEQDNGTFSYAPSTEVGYLPQTTPNFYGKTIQDLILESVGNLRQLEEQMRHLEATMSTANGAQLPALLEEYEQISTRFQDKGGYTLDYKIDTIIDGLRLSYLPRTQEVQTLSGGEKARLGIATLLLRSPDLLLLDEPTNHLDVASLEWLEHYLSQYSGAILMVSHDRVFLNQAVNQIFEIDEHDHSLKRYEGNYDAYVQAKAAERASWLADYEQQQEEIQELRRRVKDARHQIGHSYRAPRDNDKFARHFFAQRVDSTVSRNIHAAEEQLKRIEADPIPKPPELLQVTSSFKSASMQSREVIRLSHLTKYWGERCILSDVNAVIEPNTRIMLSGPNGIGKTTLFKLVLGIETPTSGEVYVASTARIGYLSQEPEHFDLTKTVLEMYRYGQVGYEATFVGKLIGYGLFRLEDMQKTIGQLSVGQRRKLEIARLMAQEPNVLLLDEPTNYISLDVLEAFESAVMNFPGPVIVISHDRWFSQRFGGQIWELANCTVIQHEESNMLTEP